MALRGPSRGGCGSAIVLAGWMVASRKLVAALPPGGNGMRRMRDTPFGLEAALGLALRGFRCRSGSSAAAGIARLQPWARGDCQGLDFGLPGVRRSNFAARQARRDVGGCGPGGLGWRATNFAMTTIDGRQCRSGSLHIDDANCSTGQVMRYGLGARGIEPIPETPSTSGNCRVGNKPARDPVTTGACLARHAPPPVFCRRVGRRRSTTGSQLEFDVNNAGPEGTAAGGAYANQ